MLIYYLFGNIKIKPGFPLFSFVLKLIRRNNIGDDESGL